jgi:hypothetical protein
VSACTKANLNGKAMKMVYTRMERREPAERESAQATRVSNDLLAGESGS